MLKPFFGDIPRHLTAFFLLKDEKYLVKRAMTVEERLQNRVAGNESTTDSESSDSGQKPNEELAKTKCQLLTTRIDTKKREKRLSSRRFIACRDDCGRDAYTVSFLKWKCKYE